MGWRERLRLVEEVPPQQDCGSSGWGYTVVVQDVPQGDSFLQRAARRMGLGRCTYLDGRPSFRSPVGTNRATAETRRLSLQQRLDKEHGEGKKTVFSVEAVPQDVGL